MPTRDNSAYAHRARTFSTLPIINCCCRTLKSFYTSPPEKNQNLYNCELNISIRDPSKGHTCQTFLGALEVLTHLSAIPTPHAYLPFYRACAQIATPLNTLSAIAIPHLKGVSKPITAQRCVSLYEYSTASNRPPD